MLAKDFDGIALVNIGDVRHVNHRHIHTDIAHVGCLLTIDQTVAGATPQVAVQTVGIANWNGGNQAVARQNAAGVVAGEAAMESLRTRAGAAARGS